MRPVRFQQFALALLADCEDVSAAAPWAEETRRPLGLHLTFQTGEQLWVAITAVAAPGDTYQEDERRVFGDPPAAAAVTRIAPGTLTPELAARYLAVAMNRSGDREILKAYSYSDREMPARHRGCGVRFHSGAKIHMLFEYVALPEKSRRPIPAVSAVRVPPSAQG